jgi:hypothetical protein
MDFNRLCKDILSPKESNISNMARGFVMLGFIILAVNIGFQVASYWIGD